MNGEISFQWPYCKYWNRCQTAYACLWILVLSEFLADMLSIPVAVSFSSSESGFLNSLYNISGPVLSLPTFTGFISSLDGLLDLSCGSSMYSFYLLYICLTHSPSRLAWSEGWQPPGTESAFIMWTGWTLTVALCHNDSTINIVVVIMIMIMIIIILSVYLYLCLLWLLWPPLFFFVNSFAFQCIGSILHSLSSFSISSIVLFTTFHGPYPLPGEVDYWLV